MRLAALVAVAVAVAGVVAVAVAVAKVVEQHRLDEVVASDRLAKPNKRRKVMPRHSLWMLLSCLAEY